MSFESYKVPQLKRFLQNRGVTSHLYRRDHLLRLCKLAEELKLEVLYDELGNTLGLKKCSHFEHIEIVTINTIHILFD